MRPSVRKWLYALVFVACLYGASTRLPLLDTQRAQHNLTLPPAPKSTRLSTLLTPLMALGRAPLVDYLWLRAGKLKDEGRYFDAYQLSEMICELQPKFASVWAFHGWNMAYNISVTVKSPEERWRWVRNGFELIRDRGIPLNPRNTQLYRELAWILFHKVGDFMDDWHFYYKLQFALIMEDILGPPPEGFVQPGVVAGDFYRDYDYGSLAKSPQRIEEVLKDSAVAAFAGKLKAFGFDVETSGVFLGLIGAYKAGDFKLHGVAMTEQANRLHELRKLMDAADSRAPRKTLEHYWRSQRLRNEVKLDPERILEMQRGFGVTMDFRLAESHALYWANLGMEKGLTVKSNVDIHRLNTNRIEFFCLQKMFHRGRLEMSEAAKMGEPPLLSPDIRIVPVLWNALLRDSKEYLTRESEDSQVSINFRTTFVGFGRTAILRYHERGMDAKAQELFDYLAKNFADPIYEKGMDGFLAAQFKQDRELNDYRVALARVEDLITRGLINYGYGEDEEAVRFIARAKDVYDFYQKDSVSKRNQIPAGFKDILKNVAHERCGQMYRPTYELICRKIGIEPLKATTSAPAAAS
jgi:hypothetical protein